MSLSWANMAGYLTASLSWTTMAGYLAAVLMFSTFYMKKMIPLRAVGASANCVFMVYAALMHAYPLFVLHLCLFPLNITRMIQMMQLVKKVKEASRGNFSMDFLVPYMTKETFNKGDVVFKKWDESNKIYYLSKGLVKIVEINQYVTDGQLIGEMGVFSADKRRTATVICESDTEFLTMPEGTVLQLYYQNPKFGFYLTQLMIQRFTRNAEELRKSIAAGDVTQRRNDRMNLKLPVDITGVNADGMDFTEQAYVHNLSSDGAYLILKNPLSKDSVVTLHIDKGNSGIETTARVARVIPEADGVGVGVQFVK